MVWVPLQRGPIQWIGQLIRTLAGVSLGSTDKILDQRPRIAEHDTAMLSLLKRHASLLKEHDALVAKHAKTVQQVELLDRLCESSTRAAGIALAIALTDARPDGRLFEAAERYCYARRREEVRILRVPDHQLPTAFASALAEEVVAGIVDGSVKRILSARLGSEGTLSPWREEASLLEQVRLFPEQF